MRGCFAAGAVATGCASRGSSRRRRPTPRWPRPVAGRGIPRRDGADGPRRCPPTSWTGVPLGSTDMGNVTQLLPGIHPSSASMPGRGDPPARFHRRGGGPERRPSRHRGAIMLARTVVALAGVARGRAGAGVLRRIGMSVERSGGGSRMSVERSAKADRACVWPTPPSPGWPPNYDDLVGGAGIHRHPELGRQEFATTSSSPTASSGGAEPEGAARRHRIDLRLRSRACAAHRVARRHGRAADGGSHQGAVRLHGAERGARLRARRPHRDAARCGVGAGRRRRTAGRVRPDLPGRRGVDARRCDRRDRRGGAARGVADLRAALRPRLSVGRVAIIPGPITSAADSIEITLHSAGGHTSRPHLTSDLVYGMGTLITGLPGVLSRRIDPGTAR